MSGKAVDTILCSATVAGASAFPTALPATGVGDSLIVRGTVGESKAHLMAAVFKSDAAGNEFRITSPLMHDNVTGQTMFAPENPTIFSVPEATSIELNEQDTLTVQGQAGAATTITGGLVIYYDDLRGTDAQLFHWRDIKDDIRFIKLTQVALSAIVVGAWTDTVITASENQLHADASYALLGYTVTPSVALVGLKGVATGNLRMCGPGFPQTLELSDYYAKMSDYHNLPYVPVFQANDRPAVFISAADSVARAGGAVQVTLTLAQLKTRR